MDIHLDADPEYWSGLGLFWIRTITNFVEFGWDPECKLLILKGVFFNFLDFICTWILNFLTFCTVVGMELDWIAKYDSSLIPASGSGDQQDCQI